ncbi:MAG: cellulase family glycosylhydrolase [Fimbriimonas sp.]
MTNPNAPRLLSLGIVAGLLAVGATGHAASPVQKKMKPLMRDFIGLNTHTTQFKTELYHPVTRLIRNYHPMAWDLADDDPNVPLKFPKTNNGLDWKTLYGDWRDKGFKTEASLQFESIPVDKWTDIPKVASAYGEAFARYFGPSGPNKLVEMAEIGNEPEKFSEEQYRSMFENMAKGMRKGDPKLLIAPCAVALGKWDKYSKDVALLKGLEPLYDVLNVHSYAFTEYYPTWHRAHPESAKTKYLTAIQEVIDWRNQNAKDKQIWLTEFGYDSTTKPNQKDGDFAKWVGVTDEEQARYIVRSYLVFSGMDMDRAYLFWFNDEDKPTLHASSGLTRDYKPKPSYHAVAHLMSTLGEYRFSKAVEKNPEGLYMYEYTPAKRGADRILVVWSATGAGKSSEVTLPKLSGRVTRAERMALKPGAAPDVTVKTRADGRVTLTVDESPVYLWVKG